MMDIEEFTFGCFHLHSNPSTFLPSLCTSIKALASSNSFKIVILMFKENQPYTLFGHLSCVLLKIGFQLLPAE